MSFLVTVSTLQAGYWLTVQLDSDSREEAEEIFETFADRAPGPSLVSLEQNGRQVLFVSTFQAGERHYPVQEVAC